MPQKSIPKHRIFAIFLHALSARSSVVDVCGRDWIDVEFPLPADVAQLVEHFTRNEGVRGSNPRVGFVTAIPFVSTRTVRTDVYVCPLCVSALYGTLGNTSASGFTLTL